MAHPYAKLWQFTWDTNVLQKKLPTIDRLKDFLDSIAEEAVFQEERGSLAGKVHYQGQLNLIGTRKPQKDVLQLFKDRFKNVSGLTLKKVYDKNAMLAYNTKVETRVSGPYYCGSLEVHDIAYSNMELKPWQRDLYQLILDVKYEKHLEHKLFRDRYIIWVSDPIGGSGKSEFIKWLRTGQKKLEVRKLPIDSVDRLISAVATVTKQKTIDLFVIDDTRTKGKDSSFEDMFESMETIKNGHVVSCMYGKYTESIFQRPLFIFFTNRKPLDYQDKLSIDRWYPMQIIKDEIIATNINGTPIIEIALVKQAIKNVEDRAAANNPILRLEEKETNRTDT